MESFITIKTFTQPHSAYIIKGHLEAEGIECFLKDELTVQSMNFYSEAIGGVKLQVRSTDAERAILLLEEYGYICDKDLEPPGYWRYLNKFDRVTGSMFLLNNIKTGPRFMLILIVAVLLLASLIYLFTIYAGVWN